ncbi:DUF317 domain-containing protein (plasmid) [Streptomyces sp. NA02950]|uniref:DUF317 domain-containing protein n=1 Tax=Streptomyces sp. NA02950 TaxID=2742137 RepID=UPI001590084E|nr:DUF317 domain-containing protein [Streptomyces sp. NA02950]QKV98228.1 DUF317 domain-containing protein [Streptomyces sp. NA02950]
MTTNVPALLADEGDPAVAFNVLTAAGWTPHTDPSSNTQVVAPGGQARLVFQPEAAEYATTDVLWKVQAVGFLPGEPGHAVLAKPRFWTATFTGEVPVELIGAFLERLVAPAGVDRGPVAAPGEGASAAA